MIAAVSLDLLSGTVKLSQKVEVTSPLSGVSSGHHNDWSKDRPSVET